MIRAAALAGLVLVAGCDNRVAPISSDDATAAAAAERKAVADTDGARRDATGARPVEQN